MGGPEDWIPASLFGGGDVLQPEQLDLSTYVTPATPPLPCAETSRISPFLIAAGAAPLLVGSVHQSSGAEQLWGLADRTRCRSPAAAADAGDPLPQAATPAGAGDAAAAAAAAGTALDRGEARKMKMRRHRAAYKQRVKTNVSAAAAAHAGMRAGRSGAAARCCARSSCMECTACMHGWEDAAAKRRRPAARYSMRAHAFWASRRAWRLRRGDGKAAGEHRMGVQLCMRPTRMHHARSCKTTQSHKQHQLLMHMCTTEQGHEVRVHVRA